ncbi:MAG: alkene reductase [Bacteroidota bacterium]
MKLLTPYRLGPLTLPNRLVMAPLTRSRHPNHVPNVLTPTYYAQRASAGLLIAEATQVTPRGVGYPDTPGIHNDAQVAAWRQVTDLVHAVGGRIVLQLWHVGRRSHSAFLGGRLPVAPSPIPIAGKRVPLPDGSKADYEVPHPLTIAEIEETAEAYRLGAAHAKRAGFDGVEIHAANGYLIEQFLASGTNHRTDAYGGSVPNRVRFLLDVTAAVLDVWDADRVGVRFSFGTGANGVVDDDPVATFGYTVERMADAGLTYVHAMRPNRYMGTARDSQPDFIRLARQRFPRTVIANGDFDRADGERAVRDGQADLIAYGRPFIANPDLALRFAAQAAGLDAPLAKADPRTYYGGGPEGYTDYPLWTATGVGIHPVLESDDAESDNTKSDPVESDGA